MAVETYDPVITMAASGFSKWLGYAKWLIPIVVIFSCIAIVWWIKKYKSKKTQWTHTLKIRRVLPGGRLTDTFIHRMRRFPLIKKAEVFELEKPFLGGYLIPELDEYSGENEFSIILDTNNRIYTNKGEFFDPDKSSVNVSAKHSEIDIQRSNLKADFQNINKVSKRIEWATLAKYAFLILLVMGVTIVSITAISKWGEAQQYKAQEAQATASAFTQLATVMETVEATVNTQKLEITYMLKELYGTQNIQEVINSDVGGV